MKTFVLKFMDAYKQANFLQKIGLWADLFTILGIPALFIVLKYVFQKFTNVNLSFKDLILTTFIVLVWLYVLLVCLVDGISALKSYAVEENYFKLIKSFLLYLLLMMLVVSFLYFMQCLAVLVFRIEPFLPLPASKVVTNINITTGKEDGSTDLFQGSIEFVSSQHPQEYLVVVYHKEGYGLKIHRLSSGSETFGIDMQGSFSVPRGNVIYFGDSFYICVMRRKDVVFLIRDIPDSIASINSPDLYKFKPYVKAVEIGCER